MSRERFRFCRDESFELRPRKVNRRMRIENKRGRGAGAKSGSFWNKISHGTKFFAIMKICAYLKNGVFWGCYAVLLL
jgi:hypothetical protein